MRPGYQPCSILTEHLIPSSFLQFRSRRFSSSHVRYALITQSCTQNCKSTSNRILWNIPLNVGRDAALRRPDGTARRPYQLLRLWYDPKVRLWRFPALRITFLRFLVGYGTSNDHIVTLLPVDRRRYLVLRRQLKRIDY